MSRLLLVLSLTAATLFGAGGVVAARPVSDGLISGLPSVVTTDTTSAFAVKLPAGAAAVEGRVYLDTNAAEVIGVAPSGNGTALEPIAIQGGFAFAAYGLSGDTISIVIAAHSAGRLELRVVIDAAADASGKRINVARPRALATLSVNRGAAALSAPRELPRRAPAAAAAATRDLVADGTIGKLDLDNVRAAWGQARASADLCIGPDTSGDANADGCTDVVDLQATVAAQGRRVGALRPSGDSLGALSASRGSTNAVTAAVNAPFVVNSTADTPDANTGNGLCADSQGRCTLRAAITESNWQVGENRIEFNVAGTAPVQIQLSGSNVPIIQDRTGGVVIDGYSQPGSHVNTAAAGSNAVPGVEIRGTAGSPRGNAFRITSPNNTIRGFLLINNYRSIFMDGPDAHHNRILGNWIGFTVGGAVHSYRGDHGVRMNVGAHDNQIGTSDLADRNVIGNFTHAIDLYGPGTNANVIQGNALCMTPSGTTTASCSTAVDHNFGPKNNLHGGPNPGDRNVIGATTLNGIEISHGWDPDHQDTSTKWQNNSNRVIGNWIGFRGDGSYSASFRSGQNNPNNNDQNGVNAYDGSNFNLVEGNYIASVWDGINFMSPNATGNTARNNVIGLSPLGQAAPFNRNGIHVRNNTKSHVLEGNVIRNAGTYGIGLTQHDVLWIKISRNIIDDMSGTPIYLQPNPNNPSTGANNLLPAPQITSATTVRASGTGISGATVEVYRASRAAGQSGLPIAYLGSTVVATNGTWTMPIVTQAGERVTALQINPANNTSALGVNVTATFEQAPPAPDANFSASQRAGTLTVDFTDSSTNSPATWSWDFDDGSSSTQANPSHTYSQAGQYDVSLTVTNGGGSDSVTMQITVTALPAGTTYAADAFGRTMSGWGNADLGGAYTLQGSLSNYTVGNGAGSVHLPQAGASRSALLNTVSQRDVDIKFRVSVDKAAAGGNFFVYAAARRNTNNEYRPRMIFNSNGTVTVNASRVNNGSETSLGTAVVVPGVTQTPGAFIWFRAQVTGANDTTIRVKAWADGQAEPAGWLFTTTNAQASVQSAGSVGLRLYLAGTVSNAPVVVSFDDYAVSAAN